jgi:hypothetical protein
MKFKDSPTFSKHYQITKKSYESLLCTTFHKCLTHITNSFGIQINHQIPNEYYYKPFVHYFEMYLPKKLYESYEFKRCVSFFTTSQTSTLEMYNDYIQFGENTDVTV